MFHEDGGINFLRNVGYDTIDYTPSRSELPDMEISNAGIFYILFANCRKLTHRSS
jgi:hypothetical protein